MLAQKRINVVIVLHKLLYIIKMLFTKSTHVYLDVLIRISKSVRKNIIFRARGKMGLQETQKYVETIVKNMI